MVLRDDALPRQETDATNHSAAPNADSGLENSESIISAGALPSIQNIEATTVAWSTAAITFAYIMIWLTYFVEGMLNGTAGALNPYVTSAFALHSLTPTVSILSQVIGGVTNITLAKVLEVFGRPQGYLCSVLVATIGLAMMAACNSVQAYAAAQVFFEVGNNGIQYSLSVFIADTTSLRNRGLVHALARSSNLITCWLGGPIAAAFLSGPGWRWCFGMFTILVPAISLPLFGLLMCHDFKAKKQGLVLERKSPRTTWQTFVHYSREFDAIGLLLLSGGIALLLLPFNLYTLQAERWESPLIICLLAFGSVLLTLFGVWEKFFASVTFIPYSLLQDRTVFGGCLLSVTLFISFSSWNSYFSSSLQVMDDLDVADASYVVQSYFVATVLSSLTMGGLIRYTGRFKPMCLFFAVPMSILGLILMIYFRWLNGEIGYIVMCRIFIAFGAGTIIICDEIACLAAAPHEQVAVAIAVLGLFRSVGSAIGLTVSAVIWQSVFPEKLLEYLPAEELPNRLHIYADIKTQLSYPVGSPTRTAIQRACGEAQVNMLAAGTGVWAIGIVGVLMWRNINVIGIKQTKAHVW
ncbi:siderophore iron transporter-like protein mirB [Massariosphaeria phaeospora]|uniref:Siderophore iron transporter-like protein mirB n=1 Tax=Massariosphaeria phaeospora TaxID=100035 RepID=A0A7C8IEC8_9PLEO|nr:siderophore iron transporter-like protein mirB [Massariosphaeria phaeospora]